MHILIANDDGIGAPGIRALSKAAVAAGHRVTVYAPREQRSAASHSISIYGCLKAYPVDMDGVNAFAVNGTPADCVRLGLYLMRNDPPDCVLAGVNNGANRGAAIVYSGTVGAAMEGALCGFPAVAVSLCSEENRGFELSAQLGVETAQWALSHPLPRGEIYNLNVPYGTKIKGVRSATISNEFIFEPMYSGNSETGYCMREGREALPETDENSDLLLTQSGYAALSIIGWNMLARTSMPDLKALNRECRKYAHPN